MKQFPSFLSVGKLISCSSIEGGCVFWKRENIVPCSIEDEHTARGCTGITADFSLCDHPPGFSPFPLSNLFPYIIMTQRRVITLQTPFGWILMRDLNHSDKWEPSAWLVLEVGEWETSYWAWPVLCPEGLYVSWRPLNLSRHMHEGFSNIKVGWWRGGLQGIVALSKGKFR